MYVRHKVDACKRGNLDAITVLADASLDDSIHPVGLKVNQFAHNLLSQQKADGLLHDPLTAALPEKSKKHYWTFEEMLALLKGLRKYGVRQWVKVANDPQLGFHGHRNNMDLRDKFKKMVKSKLLFLKDNRWTMDKKAAFFSIPTFMRSQDPKLSSDLEEEAMNPIDQPRDAMGEQLIFQKSKVNNEQPVRQKRSYKRRKQTKTQTRIAKLNPIDPITPSHDQKLSLLFSASPNPLQSAPSDIPSTMHTLSTPCKLSSSSSKAALPLGSLASENESGKAGLVIGRDGYVEMSTVDFDRFIQNSCKMIIGSQASAKLSRSLRKFKADAVFNCSAILKHNWSGTSTGPSRIDWNRAFDHLQSLSVLQPKTGSYYAFRVRFTDVTTFGVV